MWSHLKIIFFSFLVACVVNSFLIFILSINENELIGPPDISCKGDCNASANDISGISSASGASGASSTNFTCPSWTSISNHESLNVENSTTIFLIVCVFFSILIFVAVCYHDTSLLKPLQSARALKKQRWFCILLFVLLIVFLISFLVLLLLGDGFTFSEHVDSNVGPNVTDINVNSSRASGSRANEQSSTCTCKCTYHLSNTKQKALLFNIVMKIIECIWWIQSILVHKDCFITIYYMVPVVIARKLNPNDPTGFLFHSLLKDQKFLPSESTINEV